ncbi:MAG: MOSC N-terminal beta barrel domain-containing protein [Natronospirillum sp.]|uniref:MOSC domain-containing protein n=1 Tax=Natronospirillum sp. TaxID=2812955 RepID=UPI0025E84666|nr:MOSC N-terminal beta barrel domain-containing protein [Natronospirillum sp.]MCH8550666.1 MOSC N-terminal beta barrel domain-containing protein [Natronospirillum sp.]
MGELLVTGLWTYPVKGMAGNPVASLRLDECGPTDDRRWMVVDAEGHFLSQRNVPRLGAFRSGLLGQQLRLTAPDGEQLDINAADCIEDTDVTLWKDVVNVLVAPRHANNWLSHYLDQPVRLVRYRKERPRAVDPRYVEANVGFADGFPLLICHEESLQALNNGAPVPLEMSRFRPNVVVSGGDPWAEGDWQYLVSAQHRLRLVKPCVRCKVITLRPGTADSTPAVLKHLVSTNAVNGNPVFGINAIAELTESPLVLGEIMRPVSRSSQRVSET